MSWYDFRSIDIRPIYRGFVFIEMFLQCSCQNVCEALSFLLDNIYIRFSTKLYKQIVGIPMCTNCAPLVADLFLNRVIGIIS